MALGRAGLNVVYEKMGKPKYSSQKARKGKSVVKKGKNFASLRNLKKGKA